MKEKIEKTEKEWRERLTPEEYRVAREKSTEPAFTGEYLDEKRKGIYECRCCGQPLFSSESKYDSGSGWPSFTRPVDPENVETSADYGHGMVRTEIHCSRCGCHLGHVFEDGPEPTGLRYCVNSVSLQFEPETKEEAA